MNFVQKNKFWIGIVFSVVVLVILHVVLVVPKSRQVRHNVRVLEGDLKTLKDLKRKGKRIATGEKIEECGKVVGILKDQYENTLGYFPRREEEKLDCWPKVIDRRTKKIHGALFKEKYEDEGMALEKRLKKGDEKGGLPGIELGDRVFAWVDFGDDVPQHEMCVPTMKDFRILEHVSELILKSKAVTRLTEVTLGEKETLVLTVEDGAFYSRPLKISASVLYSRLLFLVKELHESPKNIVVETILIEQAAVAMAKGGEEPPVAVTLICGMLQRGEDPSEAEFD